MWHPPLFLFGKIIVGATHPLQIVAPSDSDSLQRIMKDGIDGSPLQTRMNNNFIQERKR
jgi:hypothetical protein